nr:zinc-ribbon domain-containing protein [Anoxybacillus sp. B7M1]
MNVRFGHEQRPERQESHYCPDCGKQVQRDFQFCPRCGKALSP